MAGSQNKEGGKDWFARISEATTIPLQEIKEFVEIACGDEGHEDRSGVNDHTLAYLQQQ